MATAVLKRYMTAFSSDDATVAWGLLAPVSQQAYGSLAKFASDMRAFMTSAAHEYTMGTISQDPAQVTQWIPAGEPGYPTVDAAFIVRVDYPRLANEPAGFSILLAAATPDGWRVWEVR